MDTGTTASAGVAASAIRKITIRLVPFVGVMFLINYLDRTAISFAGPNGLTADLGLAQTQFGVASGVFFIGYILLEVPSNMALHKFGARRWLARIMVSWGIVSLLFTWVSSYPQLIVLRVLLGIAEAGFFPGAILFLSLWVPAQYRPRILALFYLFQPLTTIIGAPLAGWLMTYDGVFFGLAGWRFMFFVVALPAIIVGIISWFYLTDRPADAKWLSDSEKSWLTTALNQERSATETKATTHNTFTAFRNGRVWALSVVYFGLAYGLSALAFFLPTIIGGFQQQFEVQLNLIERALLTAVPYVPAAFALYFWSRNAQKRGVQPWHVWGPMIVGAITIPLALFSGSVWLTMVLIAITASCIFAAFPNFWTLPTRFLSGAGAAAGIALINSLGNAAGFAAPAITGWLRDRTGSYLASMSVVGGFMALGALTMILLSVRQQAHRPAPRGLYRDR